MTFVALVTPSSTKHLPSTVIACDRMSFGRPVPEQEASIGLHYYHEEPLQNFQRARHRLGYRQVFGPALGTACRRKLQTVLYYPIHWHGSWTASGVFLADFRPREPNWWVEVLVLVF